MLKCSDTIRLVDQHLKTNLDASLARQATATSTVLDVSLINIAADCVHTQLDTLLSEAQRLAQLELKDRPLSLVELTDWPRNVVGASFPDLNRLTRSSVALHDVEMWLFDVFMRRKEGSLNDHKRFTAAQLFELYEKYAKLAARAYADTPLGQSRMILAHMTFVCALDYMAGLEWPLLLEHRLGIDEDVCEWLVLPDHKLTSFAFSLHRHIRERNARTTHAVLIESGCGPKSAHSFGCRFAEESADCRELKRRIQAQANRKKQQKIAEVDKAYRKYEQLITKSDSMSCECGYVSNKKVI